MTEGGSPELDALLGGARAPRRRRWGSLALLALAGLAALILFARFLYGTSSPYYTAPVERGDITPELSLRGQLHGDGEVTIVAAQDGTVTTVPDPGEARLRAGQDLVGMDAVALARALDDDTAQQTIAQDTFTRAQGALHEVQQRLDRFEMVWRRSGGRVPSLGEMERARADVARAQLDLANAQTRNGEAGQRLVRDRAALANTVARAPFAGYLVGCVVRPGQGVRAGQPLCTIVAHPERLSIAVPISVADSARLTSDAKARVLVDGSAEVEFEARLVRLDTPQGGTDRTAVFALTLPDGGHPPAPGREGTARIALAMRKDVLLVPQAALGFTLHGEWRGAQPGVYVAQGDSAPRLVPVALGVKDGRQVEVLSSDLKAGDQVIIGWRR